MEENNNEEKYETIKQEKTKVGIGMYIIVAALIITAFFLGFVVKGMLKDDGTKTNKEESKKEENTENVEKDNKQEQDVEPQQETSATSPMDNIVVNLYGGGYIYYISEGKAYYLKADSLENGRWFLLTYAPCLRDDHQGDDKAYCDGNEVYKRRAVKVEGIDTVVKLRLLHRPGAKDESFETFAIDKLGKVYIIKDGIASIYYEAEVVEDILFENQVLLKDGTIKTI